MSSQNEDRMSSPNALDSARCLPVKERILVTISLPFPLLSQTPSLLISSTLPRGRSSQ